MSILDKISGRFKKATGDLQERADAKADEVADLERRTS
jgi:hypothetical protein